jgi:hypothetical protein
MLCGRGRATERGVRVSVVDEDLSRESLDWQAHYRLDPDSPWTECRMVDVTLTTATVELGDELPDDALDEHPFFLQIDSIADDDVGIVMQAVVRDAQPGGAGPVVEIEFRARREEQLLLHLLVRLHAL